MNIRQIDLNLLVVFDALMASHSVTKAADKLCLSQSAISQALKRLRQILEDPLLVRSGNDMLPTARAQAMAQPVSRVLRELEQILTPPEEFDPASSKRSFVIQTSEYFECVIAPLLYEKISRSAPGIDIDLCYLEYEVDENELLNQEVDLVVGIDQCMSLPKRLMHELLPKDILTCMVADDHPIQHSLSAKDYACQRHVFDSLMLQFIDIVRWLDTLDINHNRVLHVESYTAVVSLVERTGFIATLPQLAANQLLRFGGVRLLTPPPGLPEFRMKMIWHPLYSTDTGLQWLRNTIKQVYSELLD